MFRKMLRYKQQIPQEECIEILKKEPRGVLSVLGDDDYPYGMPINSETTIILTECRSTTSIVKRTASCIFTPG